jgi:hypothetical protein
MKKEPSEISTKVMYEAEGSSLSKAEIKINTNELESVREKERSCCEAAVMRE